MAEGNGSVAALPADLTTLDLRHCERIAFLSDVHLHKEDPSTFQAWASHLQTLQTDALFVLGDLFDVWVGDDVLAQEHATFERECLACLHRLSQTTPVYWMVGNRDFLLGQTACEKAGMRPVSDPCVVHVADASWLLSHGDALCLSDTAYQTYRRQMRSPENLARLYASSLQERVALAKSLRTQSEMNKSAMNLAMDVDEAACVTWLQNTRTSVLVHGHTHLPMAHALSHGLQRMVLSDWDACATPPRLQSLQWQKNLGFSRENLAPPLNV